MSIWAEYPKICRTDKTLVYNHVWYQQNQAKICLQSCKNPCKSIFFFPFQIQKPGPMKYDPKTLPVPPYNGKWSYNTLAFLNPFYTELIFSYPHCHQDFKRHLISWLWVELLSQFPPFRYFPNFSISSKHTLYIEYHVCIWQVSPQLSCGGTCQI